MKNWCFVLILTLMGAIITHLWFNPRIVNNQTYVELYDTVFVKKIVHDTIPKLVYTKPLKEKVVDTLYSVDSILIPVYIPMEQSCFTNTKPIGQNDTLTYLAYVSGYKPKLDSINFTLSYSYVNKTIITVKEPKWYDRFGVGIQAGVGYGVITKNPDIFIGFGVNFRVTK